MKHLELGKPCGHSRWDETKATADAARWLLPCLPRIAREMRAGSHRDAATGLYVTYTVLMDRLRNLSDAELDHLVAIRDDDSA